MKNKKYFTITIELLFLLILIKLYFNNQKLKEENIENINEIENKDIKYINASDVDKLQKLDVDIIIVTPVFSYKEISESLKGCVNCDIYSFKDLLEVIQYE